MRTPQDPPYAPGTHVFIPECDRSGVTGRPEAHIRSAQVLSHFTNPFSQRLTYKCETLCGGAVVDSDWFRTFVDRREAIASAKSTLERYRSELSELINSLY